MLADSRVTRREMLRKTSCGFGYLALAGLCAEQAAEASRYQDPLLPKLPQFPARARRVIFLCMTGGPSQVDTFDYKPRLQRESGKERPYPLPRVQQLQGRDSNTRQLAGSPFAFAQHGQSGLWISELFPHLSKHADDLCVINSMHASTSEHHQANVVLHTGEFRFNRPSMGTWVLYGLGTENRDLPGFITISPPSIYGGAKNYGNAFLPAAFQATRIDSLRNPISNLRSSLPEEQQRQHLDVLQTMNQNFLQRKQGNSELEAVISSYELAFRMQTSLPALMDLSRESRHRLDLYGIGRGPTNDFGQKCLVARRFAEAGVRYIEISCGNWDAHGRLKENHSALAAQVDQPIAGLLTELKQRGLLEDTLVVWGGEFGRTPTAQGTGRDHNADGFTMWLAGGGVKPGLRYGATDEYGAGAVEHPVDFHDLHATILHLLGINHQQLTYRYGGRDYSLTDIHGRVVKEILA